MSEQELRALALKGKLIGSKHVRDFIEVKRPWIVRLFSWPWRPFQRTRIIRSRMAYVMSSGYVIVSYDTLMKVSPKDNTSWS